LVVVVGVIHRQDVTEVLVVALELVDHLAVAQEHQVKEIMVDQELVLQHTMLVVVVVLVP
jgi:hypothetical protein